MVGYVAQEKTGREQFIKDRMDLRNQSSLFGQYQDAGSSKYLEPSFYCQSTASAVIEENEYLPIRLLGDGYNFSFPEIQFR